MRKGKILNLTIVDCHLARKGRKECLLCHESIEIGQEYYRPYGQVYMMHSRCYLYAIQALMMHRGRMGMDELRACVTKGISNAAK